MKNGYPEQFIKDIRTYGVVSFSISLILNLILSTTLADGRSVIYFQMLIMIRLLALIWISGLFCRKYGFSKFPKEVRDDNPLWVRVIHISSVSWLGWFAALAACGVFVG